MAVAAPDDLSVFRQRLRDALTAAMKLRHPNAVRALRSALAAMDNAEAVDVSETPTALSGRIAGAIAGLGATEVERRTLTVSEATDIVRTEATERQIAAEQYERLGEAGEAERLLAEAAVLLEQLDASPAER